MEEHQKQREEIRARRDALEKKMAPEIMRLFHELQMQVQELNKQAQECMIEMDKLMMYLQVFFEESQPPQQQQPQREQL